MAAIAPSPEACVSMCGMGAVHVHVMCLYVMSGVLLCIMTDISGKAFTGLCGT